LIKIVYAASRSPSAKLQLKRFLEAANGKYNIRVAAYKDYSPNPNIDWTLDYLLNPLDPDFIQYETQAVEFYYHQIKSFNPDLIISDMELFTSYIANSLNIPIWQCSSSSIVYALTHKEKYDLSIYKENAYLLYKGHQKKQAIINLIEQADKNLIYSHFGDTINPPNISDKFQWIRPYYKIAKEQVASRHAITAAMLNDNKKIIKLLNQYEDCVAFTENLQDEYYSNIKMKNLNNEEEYYSNLFNSDIYICEGQAILLGDAFYNKKYAFSYVNHSDLDCLINNKLSQKLKLSTSIFDDNVEFEKFVDIEVMSDLNNNIRSLDQEIDLCM
jgi:hypothetical protein